MSTIQGEAITLQNGRMIVPSHPRRANARTKSHGYCSVRSCSSQ